MKKVFLAASCALLSSFLLSLPASAHTESKELAGPEMISAENTTPMTIAEAANYCRTLNSICEINVDGSPCSTSSFTGWRLPSTDELGWFLGLSSSQNYVWTRTQFTEIDKYIILRIVDGSWGWAGNLAKVNTRCIR